MSPWVYGALGAWVVLVVLAERRAPLRAATQPFAPRLATNLTLAAAQIAVAALVVMPAAEGLRAAWGAEDWGLLPALGWRGPAAALLAVALQDASFYVWHRANHRLPWLWRLHRAHHADPDLDFTSALRFHPGEVAASLILRLVQVLALGVSAEHLLLYGVAFQACATFHHANLRLPERLDRTLAWILVTPRLHGVHHSRLRVETDSNFGVIFSLWDRAARTLRRAADDRGVRIGLDEFPAVPHNRPLAALALPFRRGVRAG